MRFFQQLLFLGVLVLATATFASAFPPDRPKTKEQIQAESNYYPLHVGNKWTYRVSIEDKSVAVEVAVAKIENIDGVPLARIDTLVGGKVVANEHVRQTKDGIFRHRYAGHEANPPICLLKYPGTAGTKWNGKFVGGNEKGIYSCETANDEIEGPLGKLLAIRVSMKVNLDGGKTLQSTTWFVNNLGIAKLVLSDGGNLKVTMELEKFQIVKK